MLEPTNLEIVAAVAAATEHLEVDLEYSVVEGVEKAIRAALIAAAKVRALAAAPAWDAPYNRYYAPVEELAADIYEKFEYTGRGQKPAWTPHGNGTMQDEARRLARQQLRAPKSDVAHG